MLTLRLLVTAFPEQDEMWTIAVAALAAGARERVKEFSVARMVERTLEVYARIGVSVRFSWSDTSPPTAARGR